MARLWVSQGAEYLHLVDLDGARDGRVANRAAVCEILKAVDVTCELGGGIRDESTIRDWLAAGLTRLVIGTKALRDPAWFLRVCRQFPQRLALGLDARNGRVATDGWLQTSTVTAAELVQQFAGAPLAAVIYTDIARDGMLAGPNFQAIAELQAALDIPMIASGGVTTLDDVRRLREIGVAGCIIGRSLYEGQLTMAGALGAAGVRSRAG
jgi:phosphoribosylformimino-5-aminoimidazole carboxamide ribotide isomerase